MNKLDDCEAQLAALDAFFESQLAHGERLQYRPAAENAPDLAQAA
jgi:tRNA-dihydrouridine synthase B